MSFNEITELGILGLSSDGDVGEQTLSCDVVPLLGDAGTSRQRVEVVWEEMVDPIEYLWGYDYRKDW